MEKPKKEQLIDMVSKICNLRPPDLDAHCIPREYLTRLYRQGSLEKLGRGLYQLARADITENHSLAEACKRVPNGIVCLFLALRECRRQRKCNNNEIWR
jgi:predicted transcriptional regulator of viral defense system